MSLFDGGRRARKKRIAAYLEYRQAKKQFEHDDEYDEDYDYDYDYESSESGSRYSDIELDNQYDEEAESDYDSDEQYDEEAESHYEAEGEYDEDSESDYDSDEHYDEEESDNYSEEYPDEDLNDYPDEYAEADDEVQYEESRDEKSQYEEPQYEEPQYEEPQYEENRDEDSNHVDSEYDETLYEDAQNDEAQYEDTQQDVAQYEEPQQYDESMYQTTSFEEFDEDETYRKLKASKLQAAKEKLMGILPRFNTEENVEALNEYDSSADTYSSPSSDEDNHEFDNNYKSDNTYESDSTYDSAHNYDSDNTYDSDHDYDSAHDDNSSSTDNYISDEDYEDYNDFDDFNPSKAVIISFMDKVRSLDTIEKMSIALGVVIIASGIFAFSLYSNVKAQQDEINSFAEIGTEAENIEEIGQTGLDAMASAKSSENAATEASSLAEAIELSTGSVDVKMTLSTIVSDLKIKFTNADTGKLIASVPFKVSVKDKSGNVTEYENDDMDGIIYETGVKAGEYTVSLETLDDDKYAAYNFNSDAQTITVKDTAEYKVVDVSDEVKSEAEVNVAAEDTQVKEAVESENQDTVDWVESTTTASSNTESSSDTSTTTTSDDTYIEISKDQIVVPDSASLDTIMHKLVAEDDVVDDKEYEGSDDYYDDEDDDSDESSDTSNDTSDSESDSSESESDSDESDVTMSISATTATIEIGKTATLSATASNGSTDITWYSDDELIATVDGSGLVTAVSPGTVEITAELTSDDSVYATCNVTVISDAAASTGSLCDSGGNPVYVKEADGTYRIATADDYDKYDKFYVKSSASVAGNQTYTGWQTIGGKTYYYDKDGNPVTGNQVIQGVQYTFDSSGALITGSGTLGIDVSRWNGTIDWSAVKNSGVNYAIIRCGYRGSSSGALIEDSMFRTNIQGAVNAGIKVGVYFYTQATTEAEAIEEASFVVSMIKNYGLSYPVYLDVEKSNGRGDAISYDMRTTVCKAFCKTITNSGYSAGIYASKTWFESKFDVSALTSYKIWLAQYATTASYSKSRYDMWQYTAKGSVSGISGDVDMNLSY